MNGSTNTVEIMAAEFWGQKLASAGRGSEHVLEVPALAMAGNDWQMIGTMNAQLVSEQ